MAATSAAFPPPTTITSYISLPQCRRRSLDHLRCDRRRIVLRAKSSTILVRSVSASGLVTTATLLASSRDLHRQTSPDKALLNVVLIRSGIRVSSFATRNIAED